MKAYISQYIDEVVKILDMSKEDTTLSYLEDFEIELEKKITFFMHERLIHLIVTVPFAILEIISLATLTISISLPMIILCVLFLVLLVPYVLHYYFLENSVQKLYKLRDALLERVKSISDK